jgi:hypothetical protein
VAGPPATKRVSPAQAFDALVDAIQTFSRARGHDVVGVSTDGHFTLSMECRNCGRWVTIALDVSGQGDHDDVGITGKALAACRRYGPVAGEAMRTDVDTYGFIR